VPSEALARSDASRRAAESLAPAWLRSEYRILGLIAHGVCGPVLRARHVHLDTDRAIKLVTLPERPQTRRKALRRLRATARLRHSHLAALHDLRIGPQGEVALVLELIEGRTLREELTQEGLFDPIRACRVALGLLAALDRLHRHGVVHRAVSPDHVLLGTAPDGSEVPKLVGLGHAHAPVEQTLSTTTTLADLAGEVRYRAPEAFDPAGPGRADRRTDLYGVGLLLYEMLSGEFPFEGEGLGEIVQGHCQREPPPLDEHLGVSVALDGVIRRALAKDPRKRHRSAAEMARALVHATPGAPPVPRELSRSRRLDRRLALVAATALSALTLSIAALLGSRPGGPPPQRLVAAREIAVPESDTLPEPYLFGVAFDRDGNLYLGSERRHRIYKLAPDGRLLTSWGGEGAGDGEFKSPGAILVDDRDRVWVVDSHNHRLQLFDTEGAWLRTIGGEGPGGGTFRYPYDLAFGPDRTVFVLDQTNDLVQVLDEEGRFLRQFGGPAPEDGGFGRPWGIFVAGDRVLVTDNSAASVAVFTLEGELVGRWGTDVSGAPGAMKNPRGLVVDPLGRVFVASNAPAGIQAYDLQGRFLGAYDPTTSGGSVEFPMDLALGPDGRIWVTPNFQRKVVALEWMP
jgi:serine/threonine protein kinase